MGGAARSPDRSLGWGRPFSRAFFWVWALPPDSLLGLEFWICRECFWGLVEPKASRSVCRAEGELLRAMSRRAESPYEYMPFFAYFMLSWGGVGGLVGGDNATI